MRLALYGRGSSTLKESPAGQVLELERWANAVGHEVEGIYVDRVSIRNTRPEKEKLLRKLRLGEIDGVAFVALDIWGRNMSELVLELEEFAKTGRSLISLREGLDLSTAAGRLMANVSVAVAAYQRDRIRKSILLGLAIAKSQGKRLGRPPKTSGLVGVIYRNSD